MGKTDQVAIDKIKTMSFDDLGEVGRYGLERWR
jgi:hypothetical protein